MNLFEVNMETCNKDGLCAAVYPAGIIAMREGYLKFSYHRQPTRKMPKITWRL
ncbi:MAG: hypothetical protein ACYSUK_09450 [Planctomycetota bacterium]|jgi:hypothetical protein